MPKVSVIVPVYNVERYLAECLDSVVSQTLRDIEIVCVNDGSTDGSRDVLSRYAENDDRIVVVDRENGGLSAARNTGAAASSGDYIYFLDSDDYLAQDALRHLHEVASTNELDVLYFDAVPFFEDARMESEHNSLVTYYQRTGKYSEVASGQDLLGDMCENNDFRPAAVLHFIRADYYRAKGLSFYEGILHEDNLFSFLCMLQAERVMHVSAPYYHRRVRSDSITTVEKTAAHARGFLACYLEMLRFVIGREYPAKTAAGAAKLCDGVYRQALKVYGRLGKSERESLGPVDDSVEALVVHSVLVRQAKDQQKLRQLGKELETTAEKLDRLRRSKAYRLARRLQSLVRPGKRSSAQG